LTPTVDRGYSSFSRENHTGRTSTMNTTATTPVALGMKEISPGVAEV
jgi:hypothetical protein